MISINMIHVSDYASLVLFNQSPVGKTREAQIISAIGITAQVFSQWRNTNSIFSSPLTGITTMTTKMTPAVTVAHAGLTTARIGTGWAWAKFCLGISYVVFFILAFRRHFQ
jgi:hypothetical protein